MGEAAVTDTGMVAGSSPKSFREALVSAFEKAETDAPKDEPKSAPPAEAPAQETEAAASDADGSDTPEPVESPPATAREKPQHWSDEDWDQLKDLPDAAFEAVMRKEKEFQSGFTRKTEELAQQRKRYDQLERTIAGLHGQYAGSADRSQFDQVLTQVLPDLLGNYVQFQRNPVDTLLRLAEQSGTTDKLMEAIAGMDDGTRAHRQEKAALEQQLEAERRKNAETRSSQIEKQIEDFRNAKDTQGKLKYPHFDSMEGTMARLVAANPALTLDKAYEEAMWLDRKEDMLKGVREQLKAEMEAERRAKAKEAMKTAKPNGRAGAPAPKAAPTDRRAALLEAWAEKIGN